MVAAAAFLSILLLVAMIAVALSLRSVVKDEERTESRLHDPHTHTIVYAVPNGIDPVVFAVALRKGGHVSVVEDVGAAQGLRVECDAADREQIRRLIEGVAINNYDGAAVKVGRVVFEDER